jgi:hypothetical protein
MKISELDGYLLDYYVAKASGIEAKVKNDICFTLIGGQWWPFSPSTQWTFGGPIIERERIELYCETEHDGVWISHPYKGGPASFGPTPLIAAMRAYCAPRLGEEVPDPE